MKKPSKAERNANRADGKAGRKAAEKIKAEAVKAKAKKTDGELAAKKKADAKKAEAKTSAGKKSAVRDLPGKSKPGKMAAEETRPSGFAKLQRGLTGDRVLIGESYMDNPELLSAYLDYYWPVSRSQALHALSVGYESARSVKRLIDAGSGPGPVAAAFINEGAEEVVLVDKSPRALELALREIPRKCTRTAQIKTVVSDIESLDPSELPLWGSADCISFGHSLNELFSGDPDRAEKRAALLERWARGLAEGGRILVVEPALLSTSRDLLAVRNLLVGRGWSVAAPCCGRDRLPCPALEAGEQQTCHEEIFWKMPPKVALLAESMKLDKESLKMTWFLLEPPGGPEALMPSTVYRVVSDPMINKGGRVRRLVCGTLGRFPLSAEADGKDVYLSGFEELSRGDFIRVEYPEKRENGWGIGPGTRIVKTEGKR